MELLWVYVSIIQGSLLPIQNFINIWVFPKSDSALREVFIWFYCSSGPVKPPFVYNGFTAEIKFLEEENYPAVQTEPNSGTEKCQNKIKTFFSDLLVSHWLNLLAITEKIFCNIKLFWQNKTRSSFDPSLSVTEDGAETPPRFGD